MVGLQLNFQVAGLMSKYDSFLGFFRVEKAFFLEWWAL